MKPFPWSIVVWSVIIAVCLRPIFPSDVEYFIYCFLAACTISLLKAVLE